MTDTSRSWHRLAPILALLFGVVAFVAFAIGVTANNTSALAANGTAVPGHPELGTGWRMGMDGHMGGTGAVEITITSINGSKLSLQTTDGWTRTIDATGAAVTKAGQTIALADLKAGDQIVFRESRQSDGTYKITTIQVVEPSVAGTVSAVGSSSITITQFDGSSKTVNVTGSTTYKQGGSTVSKSSVVAGDRIEAVGTADSSGNFTATTVEIQPASVDGTVASKTSNSIVVKTADGKSVTVKVSSTTQYRIPGQSSPSLANVAVGDRIAAQGTLNGDGSLSASVVLAAANDQPGFGGSGPGRGGPGRGGPGRGGFGGFGGPFGGPGKVPSSNASPAPGSSTSGM